GRVVVVPAAVNEVAVGVADASAEHEADVVGETESSIEAELVVPAGHAATATHGVVGFSNEVGEAEVAPNVEAEFAEATLTEATAGSVGTELRIDVVGVTKSNVKAREGTEGGADVKIEFVEAGTGTAGNTD